MTRKRYKPMIGIVDDNNPYIPMIGQKYQVAPHVPGFGINLELARLDGGCIVYIEPTKAEGRKAAKEMQK